MFTTGNPNGHILSPASSTYRGDSGATRVAAARPSAAPLPGRRRRFLVVAAASGGAQQGLPSAAFHLHLSHLLSSSPISTLACGGYGRRRAGWPRRAGSGVAGLRSGDPIAGSGCTGSVRGSRARAAGAVSWTRRGGGASLPVLRPGRMEAPSPASRLAEDGQRPPGSGLRPCSPPPTHHALLRSWSSLACCRRGRLPPACRRLVYGGLPLAVCRGGFGAVSGRWHGGGCGWSAASGVEAAAGCRPGAWRAFHGAGVPTASCGRRLSGFR